jgi:DNA-directed RNA polymerase subunit alpha
MLKIKSLENQLLKPTKILSTFSIAPLAKGCGVTVGNALRRTLLSNILGTSVVGISITGINNEFSYTNDLKEDIIEVLLNTKQIILRGIVAKSFIGKISFHGPGIITSGEIQLPEGVEVVDPNQYITTVSTEKSIDIKFLIESGYGYSLNKPRSSSEISEFLYVDSAFMPVQKVNYFVDISSQIVDSNVENLILDIETNGSKTPIEALLEASSILSTTFNSILSTSQLTEVDSEEKANNECEQLDLSSISIEVLGLSICAKKVLKSANILTIADLVRYSYSDLLALKNLGRELANEVIENLENRFGGILKTKKSI